MISNTESPRVHSNVVVRGSKKNVANLSQAKRLLTNSSIDKSGRYVIPSELFDETLLQLYTEDRAISINEGSIIHVKGKPAKNSIAPTIDVQITKDSGLIAKDYNFKNVAIAEGFFKAKQVNDFSNSDSFSFFPRTVAHIQKADSATIGNRAGLSIVEIGSVRNLDTYGDATGVIGNVERKADLTPGSKLHIKKANHINLDDVCELKIDSFKSGNFGLFKIKKGNYRLNMLEIESIKPSLLTIFEKAKTLLKSIHI